MKKLLLLAGVGVLVGVAVKRGCSRMCSVDWEQRIESLPDNAPPKWMFRNISAIRANTERIRELLEHPTAEAGPIRAAG